MRVAGVAMSLFEVVPEHPSAVCSMVEPHSFVAESEAKVDIASAVAIGRDAGGVVGKNMEKLVGISDASIFKNNRLFLLRQVHERWECKRAMVAQNNMEGEDMGKILGECEVCGERGQLRTNHGKQMDSSCASIYAHLFNRLDLVAKVVVGEELVSKLMSRVAAITGKDEMVAAMHPYLPNEVTVQITNKALDGVAKAIGHIGDRGDGLVDSARHMAQELEAHRQERDRNVRFFAELREITRMPVGPVEDLLASLREEKKQSTAMIAEWRAQVEATQLALHDICRHLGIEGGGGVPLKQIVVAVAQVAAQMEQVEMRGVGDPVVASYQLPAELVLHQSPPSLRDTVLLDMALDAMRGNITGLEADRIAMLREV